MSDTSNSFMNHEQQDEPSGINFDEPTARSSPRPDGNETESSPVGPRPKRTRMIEETIVQDDESATRDQPEDAFTFGRFCVTGPKLPTNIKFSIHPGTSPQFVEGVLSDMPGLYIKANYRHTTGDGTIIYHSHLAASEARKMLQKVVSPRGHTFKVEPEYTLPVHGCCQTYCRSVWVMGSSLGDRPSSTSLGPPIQMHICDVCGKALASRSSLARHKSALHLEKTISCGTCGKLFGVRQDLQQHERVHSNEGTQVCQTCGKSYKHKQGLIRHMKDHNKESVYVCEVCTQSFKRPDQLASHRMKHQPSQKCQKMSQTYSLLCQTSEDVWERQREEIRM